MPTLALKFSFPKHAGAAHHPLRAFRRLALCAAALGLTASLPGAHAQGPGSLPDTVTWTVSAQPSGSVKPGSQLTLALKADVLDGWHIYAQEQLPKGPIPLLVTLKPNDIATSSGAITATPPTKFHDPSFNLDTQYYGKDFTVSVPVRIAANLTPGPQQIPVSIRFQSCNGQTCRPPKTVTLSAAVDVRAAE